jgi:hypothetical protein
MIMNTNIHIQGKKNSVTWLPFFFCNFQIIS